MTAPAPSKRDTFYIRIGTDTYLRASLSKAVYSGSIGAAAGITTTKPTTGEIVPGRPSNVLNGRVIASGNNGAGKRRSFRIMCSNDKIDEVIAAAKAATIDGYEINMVRSPRKVVYV